MSEFFSWGLSTPVSRVFRRASSVANESGSKRRVEVEEANENKRHTVGILLSRVSSEFCEWMRVTYGRSTWFAALKHVIRQPASSTSGYRKKRRKIKSPSTKTTLLKKNKMKSEKKEVEERYAGGKTEKQQCRKSIRGVAHFLKVLWSRTLFCWRLIVVKMVVRLFYLKYVNDAARQVEREIDAAFDRRRSSAKGYGNGRWRSCADFLEVSRTKRRKEKRTFAVELVFFIIPKTCAIIAD